MSTTPAHGDLADTPDRTLRSGTLSPHEWRSALATWFGDRRQVGVAVTAVAFVAFVAAATIHVRTVLSDVESPGFLPIWWWQLTACAPWCVVVLALERNARGAASGAGARGVLAHAAASVVVAAMCTLWFYAVSDIISPFHGIGDTRFGVFRWFFVFWFFACLLGYWAVLGGCLVTTRGSMSGVTRPSGDEPAFDATTGGFTRPADRSAASGRPARLLLEAGGAFHLVPAAEIRWIEAQDYYTVVHLEGRSVWVKKPMDEFQRELDPEHFIRIHRSTIVSLGAVERIDKDDDGQPCVLLRDGTRRRFSQARWQLFRRRWSHS